MSNPLIVPIPMPDRDDDEPEIMMEDEEGEPMIDPTVDEDFIDSAEADRIASGGKGEHQH